MMQEFTHFFLPASMMFLAEMGDKTQLLALAFSSRYKPAKVLIAMFFSILLLNGLAVLFGNVVSRCEGLQAVVQTAAAAAFLVFGVLTLKPEKKEQTEQNSGKKLRSSVFFTIFFTFFLAELGDKTQLTAISLAVKYPETPVLVLLGTTAGMFLADSFGVLAGAVMLKKIPERLIKYIAAAVFILFGLFSSWFVLTSVFAFSTLFSAFAEGLILLAVVAFSYAVIHEK